MSCHIWAVSRRSFVLFIMTHFHELGAGWILETTSSMHQMPSPHWSTQAGAAVLKSVFTNSDVAQLEKSVCMGAMLWSKAAYWESPVLASLSCCAAWESWKAASGWAESGNKVHSLSSKSATPLRSSQKPKAKAALRRRLSSWQITVENRPFKSQFSYIFMSERVQSNLPYKRFEFYLVVFLHSSESSAHQSEKRKTHNHQTVCLQHRSDHSSTLINSYS